MSFARGHIPANKIRDLEQHFQDNDMDYALFVELVENGISEIRISKWEVQGVRAFPRTRHSIRNYIRIYYENKNNQTEESN
jgi:hypothetical protein